MAVNSLDTWTICEWTRGYGSKVRRRNAIHFVKDHSSGQAWCGAFPPDRRGMIDGAIANEAIERPCKRCLAAAAEVQP